MPFLFISLQKIVNKFGFQLIFLYFLPINEQQKMLKHLSAAWKCQCRGFRNVQQVCAPLFLLTVNPLPLRPERI